MERLRRSYAPLPRSIYVFYFPFASSIRGFDTSNALPCGLVELWNSLVSASIAPQSFGQGTHCPPWRDLAVPKRPTPQYGLSEPRLIGCTSNPSCPGTPESQAPQLFNPSILSTREFQRDHASTLAPTRGWTVLRLQCFTHLFTRLSSWVDGS
ncbi:hypothetical protein JTB14_034493 [Gonioctena quinquepunctata]|nr:hypothetical protein JTB14_034493 [Gonioctena quinquepunctata]